MSASGIVKEALRPWIRAAFRLIPFPWALSMARMDRRLFNQLPPGHRVAFSHYHGDLRVQLDTTYPIERQMLSGEYDPETARVARAFVRPGDVCADVGANVGAHTLLLAKLVGDKGKVYAFEPGPPIFERLRANLELNPDIASVVVAERLGVSDAEGSLFWNEETNNRGNAHLRDRVGIEVPVKRLDGYFDAHPPGRRVAFIKIDVESMELQVLRGARRLLDRDRPVVYFETMPGARAMARERSGNDPFEEIEKLLTALGYALFDVTGRQGRLVPVSANRFGLNTLAVPKGSPAPAAIGADGQGLR